MKIFENKVAVVTGTANPGGIGFALSRGFAAAGCRVVLADIDREGVEARAEELRSDGTDALAVRTDMSDNASVEQLAAMTYEHFGATHILVLNHVARPGGAIGHSLLSPEPDQWQLHIGVNLLGTIYGIKAFVPRMIAGGEHGHVLATTSVAGSSGTMYGNGPYAVTKAAIVSLMECLYGQLRDVGADIVASLISPPITHTRSTISATEEVLQAVRKYGIPSELSMPEDVVRFTIEAIENESFWAHPDLHDDERLTGGRNRENIEWENGILQARADAMIRRAAPDPYLWGPPATEVQHAVAIQPKKT